MKVNVKTHHVTLPSNAGTRLAARARIALARFQHAIAGLELTLKDVNGPRGGADKVCVLRARMADGRQIIVIDRNTHLRRAIGRSLRRAKALIAKQLARRHLRRHALPASGHGQALPPAPSVA